MSSKASMEYVSIIGGAYLHPLARLFEALASCNLGPPGELATQTENGYSVSIVALSALFVESVLRRVCHIRSDPPYESALRYARRTFPSYAHLDSLEEIFVARDIVVHNHLWGSVLSWDDAGNMSVSDRSHMAGGDTKFDRVFDPATRKTKLLGINLVPTAVCHVDAVVVFSEAVRFALYLEGIDRNYFYLSDSILEYDGKAMRFSDFAEALRRTFADAY